MTPGRITAAPWRVDRRHSPIPGESLDGYVARVCALEHLPTALEVTAMAGVVYGHRADLGLSCWDGLATVADCLRVDVAELQSRSHPRKADGTRDFFGLAIDERHLESHVRRFSPESLAISPHHRALWALRPIPFCDVSWEFLTDRCHRSFCGAVQRWHHTHGVDLCDVCGGSLVDTPVGTVPADLQTRLRLAIGLVHVDPRRRAESADALPPGLQTLDASDRFDLLVACARLHDPTLTPFRKPLSASPPEQLAAALAGGWSLLAGWPGAVERLASARIARRVGRHGDGSGGAILAFLKVGRYHSRYNGSGPYRSQRLRDVVGELVLRFRTVEAECFDIAHAARVAGLKPSTIGAMRRTGVLPAAFTLRGNRPVPQVRRDGIEALAARLRGSDAIVTAARRLGLPYHGVEQLMALGCLVGIEDPAPKITRGPIRVAGSSVQELDDALLAMASPEGAGTWRSLPGVMDGVGGRLKPWGPLLRAMTEGRLRYAVDEGDDPIVERIRVQDQDVQIVSGLTLHRPDHDFPFATHMSIRDALRELNLQFRTGRPLLQQWSSCNGDERTVPVEAVETIAASVAGPRELGSVMGITSAAAWRLMTASGLVRISTAGFDRRAALEIAIARNNATLIEATAFPDEGSPCAPASNDAGDGANPFSPQER